jgi:hypothetical protein
MNHEDMKSIEAAQKATASLLEKMTEQGWLTRTAHNHKDALLDFTEDGRKAMTMLRTLLHPGGGELPALEGLAFLHIVKSAVYLPT